MNSLPTKKYSISSNEIEKKSFIFDQFKEWFDIDRLKKVSSKVLTQERYYKKIFNRKKLSLDNC